jgi:hypothetical protein
VGRRRLDRCADVEGCRVKWSRVGSWKARDVDAERGVGVGSEQWPR